MYFIEIEEKQEVIFVNIEKILMFKLTPSYGSDKCCIILSDNSIIWCDKKYFSVLKSKLEKL